MEPKYLSWNFANFISVNLMLAVMTALIILLLRWSGTGGGRIGAVPSA